MKKILVTAIGGPTGFGVVKCLKDIEDIKMIGLDADIACPMRKFVDEFEVIPKITSKECIPEVYRKVIVNIIEKYDIDVLIPTLPPELEILKDITECKVIISNIDYLDKCKIYEDLKERGLCEFIPKCAKLESLEEINSLTKKLGFPESDFCMKLNDSHGGIGFKRITTFDRYNKNLLERGSEEIPYEIFKKILKNMKDFKKYSFMEFLPGEEYSVDLFSRDGKLIIAVPRTRERVSTAIVTKGSVVQNKKLIEASKKIAESLNLNYFCNIQFKQDKNGEFKLIDINPRFCGSHVMSFGANVNFPLMAIKAAFGEEIEIPEVKWGTQMIRYWESEFYYGEC